jgi:hypothetical protein
VSAPVLEARSADELAAALYERMPAFLPGWQAPPGGRGSALLAVYGRFLRALAERIDAAPDKNELAFLDLLGLDVLPAGAARAPVVFSPIPGGGDGRAAARTRLGAKGSDPARPIVFETEKPIALAQARLAEVVTVRPDRDEYSDHTAAALGGRPFTLWDNLQLVAHELYLAHDLHFALAGESSVELEFLLVPPGTETLDLEWSWWDGKTWRAFKKFHPQDEPDWSLDGTLGLSRSGTVRLVSGCAASKERAIGGWTSHWLRAKPTRPLRPADTPGLAQVDRIAIRTVLDQTLGPGCTGGLLPDAAFADGQRLDFTKPAQPLGAQPRPGSALYLACAEAFSRPGATVTVCVQKATTAEEEADAEEAKYELNVNKAKQLLDKARKAADLTKQALEGLRDTELRTDNLPDLWAPGQPQAWYDGIRQTVSQVRANVLSAVDYAIRSCILPVAANPAAPVPYIPSLSDLQYPYDTVAALVEVAKDLSAQPPSNALLTAADTLTQRAQGIKFPQPSPFDVRDRINALPGDLINLVNAVGEIFLPAALDPIFDDAEKHFKEVKDRVTAAKTALGTALTQIQIVIDNLKLLSPMSAAAASGFLPPTLASPKLAWEYWNGSDWQDLAVNPAGNAASFRGDGTFSFTVRDDWVSSTVNGVDALWARARLDSGSYAKLRLVSWTDQESEAIHFLPIIEPRPPVLDALRVGYSWASEPEPPQHVLSLNDFRWEDHTEDAGWHGGSFAPFRPIEDPTPSLYLGFDGLLPADELGFLFDVELGDLEQGPPLDWEHWDGAAWRRLPVGDETDSLAVPGIVSVLWPGGAALESATVTGAAGFEIRLANARSATRFVGGDLVWLQTDGNGELATVESVAGNIVTTAAPLSGSFRQANLVRADLPRFGRPRTWLRARLRTDGEPLRARVRGIYPNAGWAAQVETVEDELLGGGNGEPRQVFFLTRTPVLSDELIVVRELSGARAHVEYPLLVDELRALGIREDQLRVVADPRTGDVQEVWVPWRRRTTLAFSGPHDRDYTLERTRGRILFGDGIHGLKLPAGLDNVRARRYRAGGGSAGNVPAGAIAQVLSGALVGGVTNPVCAEGGADSEPVAAVLARGPLSVRHRRQALTAADIEALAREASPGVALAHASSSHGHVTVAIVPYSADALPEPSWELRREVRDFLRLRAPASLGGAISVVAPAYTLVGASTVVAPRAPAVAGPLAAAATEALRGFFHPLTGGPESAGWSFGREVHLSDVAALLAGLEDVDAVEDLVLVVDGAPQPESIAVAPDRLVAAGTITVELGGVG